MANEEVNPFAKYFTKPYEAEPAPAEQEENPFAKYFTKPYGAEPVQEKRPYRDRREALDDAVLLLEEGHDPEKVINSFGDIGISKQEIAQHGTNKNSFFFAQKPVIPPVAPVAPGAPQAELKETQPTTVPISFFGTTYQFEPEAVANVFKRAKTNFQDMATSLLHSTGAITSKDAAFLLADNARKRAAAAPSKDIQEGLEAIGNAKVYGDAALEMLKNPKATLSMLVDSILVTAPSMVTLGASSALARAGLQFAASSSMEYTSVLADVLADHNIDITDTQNVAKALDNPKIQKELKEVGAKRGLIVGAFDALTAGLAGRFMKPVNEAIAAGKLAGAKARQAAVGSWAKELAMQAAGGSGGELLAQKAVGQNKPAEVWAEGLAEAFTAPLDVRAALRETAALEKARLAREEALRNLPALPPEVRPIVQEAPILGKALEPGTPPEEEVALPPEVPPEAVAEAPPAEAAVPEETAAPPVEAPPVAPTAVEAVTEEPEAPPVPEAIVPEAPVTPVTPPQAEEVAPAVSPVPPTKAAEALPETPTVAPEKNPKIFEPAAPQHKTANYEDADVPVKDLRLSMEVPQFKLGASSKGIVDPLEGTFTQEGVAPIAVWRRINGDLEVISGRHRFDLAQRSGTKTIKSQIYDEASGFTSLDAAIKDAELNIRDNQGEIKDYVNYFKNIGIDRETAQSRGLLAREKGKRGFAIANQGSDSLISALNSNQVGPEAAFYIALNAPNDERLQNVGIKAIRENKSVNAATNLIQAVKALAGEQDTTTDMFGFDDSAMREAEEMAKIAASKQRALGDRISAISGAAKNPKLARAEGIDIKDPEAVLRRIEQLRAEKAAWDNWSTNPDLISEIRAERGTPAPKLAAAEEPEVEAPAGPSLFEEAPLLTAPTPKELKDKAETEAANKRKEAEAAARVQQDIFGAAPEPESAPDENDPGFIGASDKEVADVARAFDQAKEAQEDEGVTHVFDAPKKADVVRMEDKARIYVADAGYLTVEQAKKRIEKWKKHAEAQGDSRANSEKIVLSLFDMTGEWSKPWEEAGYQVYRFDIQTDPEFGDVNKFSSEFFNDLYGAFEGQDVYAILAACPCTDFASSGARHFAAKDADGRTVESVELVNQTLATIEYFKPSIWAIENPVGRIEKLTGLPPWRLSFNPNHFGDPYTKKTLLWGRFNADLPIAPVEPTEGSKMHRMYGGKSQATKNARSVTPEGFAYSFFMANNAIDNPVMALAYKYDMMNPTVFVEALQAGVTEREIMEAVDDPYYFSLDYDAAAQAVRDLVAEKTKATTEEVKGETRYMEEVAKDTAQKMLDGFIVGDIVRVGNSSGVVVGIEGDYVRYRPDTATSAKAYRRVQKRQVTLVARPDTTSTVSAAKDEKKFGEEQGQLNADMGGLIQLLGANMYASNLSDVAIKELLQNAFDAVKGAVSSKKSPSLYNNGEITITVDKPERTISVTDNARGMTPEIVREAFFTVAGSNKSDLDPQDRSGGLGLAKMGFMLGAERLILNTVRDGVRVRVDTTAKDIANSNFKIMKSPAPKSEHGTTVTVKIPENYTDPKNGEQRMIYFPWGADSIAPLKKPLIGPATVKLDFRKGYGDPEVTTLAVGTNFDESKYQRMKVNFSWGTADVYFANDRSENANYPKHQVLSSGVYQFDSKFPLNESEPIPFDIIVNVKPNVDAKHPDYPFENSRERFKSRLEKDVKALIAYLQRIARGIEAADLQENFKNIVSMPRIEAGQDLVETSKKLKKQFDKRGQAGDKRELPPMPNEVSIEDSVVRDTLGRLVVDADKERAKEAEKKKESTFDPDRPAPEMKDFLLEMEQDPRTPIFHNNTNVDFLAVGEQYGDPQRFFAELGTLLVEMKEAVGGSGMYPYEALKPENLFFGGISIDKQYGGLHIKVPYKAVLLNPFYDWGARSLFGVREVMLGTMIHEIAHTADMEHGVGHNSAMMKVSQWLADEGLLDYYRDALLDVLLRHESAFTAMREAYGKSTTRNTAKSLEDYGKSASAAKDGSDADRRKDALGFVPARARPRERAAVSERADEAVRSEDAGGAGEDSGLIPQTDEAAARGQTPFLAIEPTKEKESKKTTALIRESIRAARIKQYAAWRRALGKIAKDVSEGKASITMQRNATRLLKQSRLLKSVINATKPVKDSPEQFFAKALKEYDAGNLSKDVLDVIKAAYNKDPSLLSGISLSVTKAPPGKEGVAAEFKPLERIIVLYKGTGGISDPVSVRHELEHSLEQMMTPEQKIVLVNEWWKALNKVVKQNPDEQHQKFFDAIVNFLDDPKHENYIKAKELMPNYGLYQFLNPSEYWAVNSENLMAAHLGSAWEKFKQAVRKLFEGLKKVFGFDNKYYVHKIFDQVMRGSKERISHDMLVNMAIGEGKPTTIANIQDDQKLIDKHKRPRTPMLDTTPIKTFLTRQYKNGKEFFVDALKNPKEAMVGTGDSVMDGVTALRVKGVWYGAGLESRDFERYGGQLRASNGLVTASVALDNAIRSGNIATEVVFRGGIKFDPKSGNFVAVERDLGMKGVYKAEAKLKKKLGDQLGTDIIQGYLEAKRSISIMDELYKRESELKDAKKNLENLKQIKADTKDIQAAKTNMESLENDLDAINKAASSVNMSKEEMYEFAELDKKHSELEDIMKNWTAVNQNLLYFWRQVGLLSEGRYDTLSAIKDYVPWYRIMNDEEDVHSSLQSTTRTLTNIGREKLFKRGRPVSIVDFRAKQGQKDFKIQPSSVVKVEVNGKKISQNLLSVTRNGEVHINMDLDENDLVVFKTNREIENIVDNMTRNVMRMTMNGIRQYAANRVVMEYGSRNADNKIMTFPRVDKEKGRLNWVVNGKKVVVEIQDPLVAASIYGMESINLQMIKPIAMMANLVRRSITLSGVFQVKQVFKDAPTAALVTGVKNPIALIGGVWKGFLTSLVQPALKAGGVDIEPTINILKAAGIGGFHSPARTPEAEIKRRIGIMNSNVFSAIIKTLDHIGDSSDIAQRVATYKRVMAETGDEAQALYQAANVINFLHHGSSGYAQGAVKLVPFMGAYANSMDVLINSLAGGGLKGMSRKKAIARLGVTAGLLSGMTLLYCMLAGADPDYDELDDQTKLKNIMIPGTKIMLPMNTSAALIFKAIPELIYDWVTKEGTEKAYDKRRLKAALANAARDMLLGPEPIPAGFKPLIEVSINHDFFTGRTVIPESLKDVEAAERYTASTSELGKMLSAMLVIPGTDGKRVLSPISADHIIRGMFGTAGATAQWIVNSIAASTESRLPPSVRETPITGAFLREEAPRGREELFYDFKEIVFEKYKTWQKMIDRGDYDAAEKYLDKNVDISGMYAYINRTEDKLKKVNNYIRWLSESKDTGMTPSERVDEISKMKKVKIEILEPVKELRRESIK